MFLSDYLVNVPNGEGDEADDNGGDEGAGEGQATHPVHKLISIHTTTIRKLIVFKSIYLESKLKCSKV